MPRLTKALPENRADYTFGDLVYWHLFRYGTRPTGDPADEAGRIWEPDAVCTLLEITDRTLRNWIFEKNLPDSVVPLSNLFFGNNGKWDRHRLELQEKFEQGWARRRRKTAGIFSLLRPEPARDAADDTTGEAPPEDAVPLEAQEGLDSADTGVNTSGEAPAEDAVPSESQDEPESDTSATSDNAEDDASGKGRALIVLSPIALRDERAHSDPSRRKAVTSLVAGLALLLGVFAWMKTLTDNHRPPTQIRSDKSSPTPTPPAAPSPETSPQKEARRPEPPAPLPSPTPQAPTPDQKTTTPQQQAPMPAPQQAPPIPGQQLPPTTTTPPVIGSPPQSPPTVPPPTVQAPAQPPPSAPTRPPVEPEPPTAQLQQPPIVSPPPTTIPPTTGPPPLNGEERREAARRRVQKQIDDAQKAAEERAKQKQIDDAARKDREAETAAQARRDREEDIRNLTAAGFSFRDKATVAIGTTLGMTHTQTVVDCAISCLSIGCDAFAYSKDNPHTPNALHMCNRFRGPITFREHPYWMSGERLPDSTAATPAIPQVTGPVATRSTPTQSLHQCTSGARTVAGFRITCDRILSGGTTLGSTQLAYTVANIDECAAKCQPVARCVGFTFNAAGTAGKHACYLFGSSPEGRMTTGWIAGER